MFLLQSLHKRCTLHAKVAIKDTPCVYFLFPNETYTIYVLMRQAPKNFFSTFGPSQNPPGLWIAAINALQTYFPHARISGRFLHLYQTEFNW